MITTFDVTFPEINTYFVSARPADGGRMPGGLADDADAVAWRIEPGHYLDTPGGLVVATPELAARAISWSRG